MIPNRTKVVPCLSLPATSFHNNRNKNTNNNNNNNNNNDNDILKFLKDGFKMEKLTGDAHV